MRLKSFHGANLNDAMRQVREALGDNAIIVATRDDDNGGTRVTAAIDDAPAPVKREVVSNQDKVGHDKDGSDIIEIIATALLRHQVPNALAERLLSTAIQFANDDPVLALAAAFDTHIKFLPIADDKAEKPLILIGPPGAGKTLCTAKFATKATLDKKAVTVFTTDTERAGGMEQLAVFTRLLKTNLMEIEDAHALREAIAIQKSKTLILIDTAGYNPFAQNTRDQLLPLVTAAGGEAVVVLPADMDSSQAIDMVQEFRALGATRLLMTRLDLTRRLGSLLRTAFESRLPLANISATHKVTEPPQSLNPVVLARMILPKKNENAETTVPKAVASHAK